MKSLEVFASDPKTRAFRDPLSDECGMPIETDDGFPIQSGQRGVAVSNGNINQLSLTASHDNYYGSAAFGAINFDHSTLSEQILSSKSLQEHPKVFEERFWQCHDSLFFIACRVLGSARGADEVVQDCFLKASRNPPRFESDGDFGSWVLRILIDEALLTRHQENSRRQSVFPNDKGARSDS